MLLRNSTIWIFIFLVFCSHLLFAQSPEKNYILKTILLDTVTDPALISELEDWQKSDVIEYYDGLGRLAQTNNFHSSPAGLDFIQHVEYDTFGRQKFNYMPFPSDAEGDFLPDGKNLTTEFYTSRSDISVPVTTVPFGESEFDNSPLNRVMKQGFPGASWQLDAHPQQFDFLANTSSDNVSLFEYDEETHQFSSSSYYPPDSLYVYKTVDENGNISRSFKDKSSRVVLNEQSLTGTKIRTYYIYNINGLLAVVIQPEGSALIGSSFSSTAQFIGRWCFTYIYDYRNRMIEKRIPGMQQPVYSVYDSLDRLILTQDGNLRESSLFENQWYFTKYDALGRPVIEGLYRNFEDTTRAEIDSLANSYFSTYSYFESRSGIDYEHHQGYTDNAFPPIEDCDILKVYYYDNYDFDFNGTTDFTYQAWRPFGDLNFLTCTKGMLTGTKVKILIDQILYDPLLTTLSFYDQKSRVIQQLSQNHFGHFDTLNTKYSFAGDVLKSRYTHSGATAFHVVTDSMVYDHARRLTETYQKLDDQPQIQVAEMNYNEIGLLVEKNLHHSISPGFLQSLDYSYNIRGWLTGINTRGNGNDNNDVFSQELVYDSTITALNCTANYNGNITANIWKHTGYQAVSGYGYSYDAVNRLTFANYGNNTGGTWTINQRYSVPILEYDKNGNIKRLRRHYSSGQGYSILDDLYYFYLGNQIVGVNDYVNSYMGFQDNGHYYQVNDPEHTTEYFYDNNGNLTRDLNKGITSIIYNHLNLPYKIEFENNRRIYYIYDANGTKLRKYFYEDNRLIETTDYSGMFIYSDDHLDNILTSEGRLKWNDHDSLFYAEYFIKDHLGNVRTVVTTDPNFNFIAQQTDYYPFGLEIAVSGTSDNQIKYNSKELQTDAKLGWYDYGARFYDPVLGRWHSVDPMAETSRRWSPYTYCMNNPIRFIDPDGMNVDGYTVDDDGYIERVDDTGGDKYDVLYSKADYSKAKQEVKEDGSQKNEYGNPEPANQIMVNNTDILPALEGKGTVVAKGLTTGSINDVFNVFKFAADNSNVEWALARYSNDKYALWTDHDEGDGIHQTVSSPNAVGLSNENASLHSHPGILPRHELSSMGAAKGGGYYSYSDWGHKIAGIRPYDLSVYFPNTKNIYNISKYEILYIRNIGIDYKRFYYGTLNHR
jgi:RHS repeat-associated protein